MKENEICLSFYPIKYVHYAYFFNMKHLKKLHQGKTQNIETEAFSAAGQNM